MEEKYELTERDKSDKEEYRNKLIKFGIPCVACIILFKILYGTLVGAIFNFASIPLSVISVVYLVKFLLRTPAHYKRKSEEDVKRKALFYLQHPEKFADIKSLIAKMGDRTARYGKNILNMPAEDINDPSVYRSDVFYDYRYYKENGEFYEVYVSRYKDMIVISHIDPLCLILANFAFCLADEHNDYKSIPNVVAALNSYMKTFRYRYDKRRDGGYLVVVPKGSITLTSAGGDKARMTFRSELGVEYIDLHAPDSETYDSFAYIIE